MYYMSPSLSGIEDIRISSDIPAKPFSIIYIYIYIYIRYYIVFITEHKYNVKYIMCTLCDNILEFNNTCFRYI
jgi:hypothetical protein